VPRAALSQREIDDFRETLCAAATRRFAEAGYDGVSLRGLAAELGCSPMTPYRYFRNKDEIFAAVRAAAFSRFADAQEANLSREKSGDPHARLRALGRTYVHFARTEPHAYRIMFELDQDPEPTLPEQHHQEGRAWFPLHREIEAAIEAGVITGDADTVAHLFWAGLHGIVSLHLAGKLKLGRILERLAEPMMDALFRGNAASARARGGGGSRVKAARGARAQAAGRSRSREARR
jgi:AcrR family transcriptional regulator